MNLTYKALARVIDFINHRKKKTRKAVLGETRDLSGKRIEAHGVYYHPMPVIGIQPLSINDILAPHAKRIDSICRRLGLKKLHPRFTPDKMVRKVIENVAAYIHLLPASENHHHESVGGLLAHSLEVADIALGRALSKTLAPTSYPDIDSIRRERYLYAVFVAGLLHDIGKPFTDMRIYDMDNGNCVWEPRRMSLAKWAVDNGVKNYRVEYVSNRSYTAHERIPTYVMQSVLTDEAKEYLAYQQLDDVFFAIEQAISHYMTEDGYIHDALRHADSHSTLKDLSGRTVQETGRRENSLATNIIKALRRQCSTWNVNEDGGQMWMIGGEVYLSFPNAIESLIRDLKALGISCPTDTQTMYNTMVEQHILASPEADARMMFWSPGDYSRDDAIKMQSELLNRSSRRWLVLCKVKSVHYVYGENITPQSSAGVMSIGKSGLVMWYPKMDLYRPVKLEPPKKESEAKAGTTQATTSAAITTNQIDATSRDNGQSQGRAETSSGSGVQPPLPGTDDVSASPVDAAPESRQDSGAQPQAAAKKRKGAKKGEAKIVTFPAAEPVVNDGPVASPADNKLTDKQQVEQQPTGVQQDWGELGDVTATQSYEWLKWCRNAVAEGVMHHRVDGDYIWLLVSKVAKGLMMNQADIALKLKSDGYVRECRRLFDPDAKDGWYVMVDGEMQSLLSDLGVAVLKGEISKSAAKAETARMSELVAEASKPAVDAETPATGSSHESQPEPKAGRKSAKKAKAEKAVSDMDIKPHDSPEVTPAVPDEAAVEAKSSVDTETVSAEVRVSQSDEPSPGVIEPAAELVSDPDAKIGDMGAQAVEAVVVGDLPDHAGGGMRVPEIGNGEIQQIAEVVQLVLATGGKREEDDIIHEGGMYLVRVSFVRRQLGRRMIASAEWMEANCIKRGRASYIAVPDSESGNSAGW